jgi:hypothetical protein
MQTNFNASTTKSSSLLLLLKPLSSNRCASCIITSQGLTFVIHIDKTVALQSLIPSDLFESFSLNCESIDFVIDLSTLIDALSIFSNLEKLQIKNTENELIMTMESPDMDTRISIAKLDLQDFGHDLFDKFTMSDTIAKIIIRVFIILSSSYELVGMA